MFPTAGFALVAIFWLLVFIIDKILLTKRFAVRYRKVLERTGITISLLQIKSYTKYFNILFKHVGKTPGRFIQIWFSLGVIFAGLAMVFSVYVLLVMFFKNMTEEKPEQMLTPVIPGVNIPWRHMIYYFMTLMISATFHEMGHAIAAVKENVRVLGFGWFFLPIFCGAYVEVQTDHLQVISPLRQLRIHCAGVWHNCVSALLAAGCWWILPYFYMLFYTTKNGAVISHVFKDSSVVLHRGDQIYAINNCSVKTSFNYFQCLNEVIQKNNQGYCHNRNAIFRRNTSIPHLIWHGDEPECCGANSQRKFCFSHEIKRTLTHSCLPARSFVVNNFPCHSNSDCLGLKDRTCVVPMTSKINRFIRISHRDGEDILFVGNPYELSSYISVTDYLPKTTMIPLDIPDYLQTFLVYFASLSGALAILNMIPCYCLDGQNALLAFIEFTLPKLIKKTFVRAIIYHSILFFGTLLLFLNLIFAFWNLRGQGVLSLISQGVEPG